MSETKNSQYVPIITIEEYEKNKKEYTQKALRELQSQMKTIDYNSSRSSSNNSNFNDNHDTQNNDVFNDDNDYLEDEIVDSSDDLPNVNVIINQHPKTNKNPAQQFINTGLRKRKPVKRLNDNESLAQTLFLQKEQETHELNKFKNLSHRLENDLEEEERKNHFLKLDLNNANVDNINLTRQNEGLIKENTKLKEQVYKDWMTIILLKIIIALLVLVYIYNLF